MIAEQALVQGQEGYQEKGRRPLLAQGCVLDVLGGAERGLMLEIDWYDIKAPSFFETRTVGKTLVNRSQGLSAYILLFLLDKGLQ